jgi:hypothetical protein
MPRNYDTTNAKPYTRCDEFTVKYEQGFITLTIKESESVVLSGKVRKIADSDKVSVFGIPLSTATVTAPIPVVDPATGQPTGQTVTLLDVISVVTAVIRTKQLERDAAEALAQG